MKVYPIHAILKSPLAVRRDRQSNRSHAADAVVGTVLRGALAHLYLEQKGDADETFQRLFLDDSTCRFPPLDPGEGVLPTTAIACKRRPGFVAEDLAHGMADQLWPRIADSVARSPTVRDLLSSGRQCNHLLRGVKCGADMKNLDGFYRHSGNGSYRRAQLRTVVATHVGIDRVSHTAADEILFSIEAFAPQQLGEKATEGKPTVLYGRLEAEDDVAAELRNLLTEEQGILYLGHARTRGYGRARLTIGEPMANQDPYAGWQEWSDGLAKYLAEIGAGGLDGEPFFFSLSLPNGAILVDALLRYTLDLAAMVDWLPPLPDPCQMDHVLDLPPQSLEGGGTIRCLTAVTGHERIRGWNAAHGLPRQDEWGVTRGAVYAYSFEGTAEQRIRLLGRLETLTTAGTGLRLNEGFGRVVVSDPFHMTFLKQERTT
jgi:CRISPR-associated Csx10 family RAMP protein